MPVQMQNRGCGKEVRKFSFTRGGLKALIAKKQLRTRPASLLLTSRSLEGSGRPSGRNLWSGAAGNGPGACPSHRRRRQHSCEQTEAGKRLLRKAKTELPFGGGELFPYSKPPGGTLSDPHALPDGGGQGASAAGNAPGGGKRPPAAETALPGVSNSSGPYPPVDRNVADAAYLSP